MRIPGTVWPSTDARDALDPAGWTAADRVLADPDERWVRAVDVAAPADVVWRWLCQFRAAPYSYDWIDNLGRRSPRTLTPGLDELAEGDRFLIVFALDTWEPGARMTLRSTARSRWLPRMAIDYAVEPRGPSACRLVARVPVGAPPALRGTRAGRALLAGLRLGDLVMMRKQLLTVRDLAEAATRRP